MKRSIFVLWIIGVHVYFQQYFNYIEVEEVPEKPTTMPQVTDKFYQIMLYRIGLTTGGSQPLNFWWWKTLIDCIVKCKYYYNAFAIRRCPMQTRLSVIQLQSRIIATNTKVLFIYYNLCTSLKLDSLSCSFISIFFLSFFLPKDTKMYKEQ
jgi:hypothetical protein